MPRRPPYAPPLSEQDGLRTLLATLLAGDDLVLSSALDTLAVDAAIVRMLAARRAELVDRARAAGASWTDVGVALDLDRSTVFTRYAHPTD